VFAAKRQVCRDAKMRNLETACGIAPGTADLGRHDLMGRGGLITSSRARTVSKLMHEFGAMRWLRTGSSNCSVT